MGDCDRGAAESRSEGGQAGLRSRVHASPSLLQDSWERLLAFSKYSEQESFAVVFQPFYGTALSPHAVSEGGRRSRPLSPSPTQLGLTEPEIRTLGEMLPHSLVPSGRPPRGVGVLASRAAAGKGRAV